MNSRHKKVFIAIFADPVNGSIAWDKVEGLLVALDCQVIGSGGSAITIERNGLRLNIHRPHPSRDSLKYRIKAVREFLMKLEIKP